jgi:hypothetical protein
LVEIKKKPEPSGKSAARDVKFAESWLAQNCTMVTAQGCAEGTGLTKIHRTVFEHNNTNVNKVAAVISLAEFYSNEQNIINIWNGGDLSAQLSFTGVTGKKNEALTEIEKAFIIPVIHCGGREFKPVSKMTAAELGLKYTPPEQRYHYSYGRDDIFSENEYYGEYFHLAFLHLLKQHLPETRAVLLFPGGKVMPPFVVSVLKKMIPPFKYKYGAFKPGAKDRVICREDRISDFAAVVRFAGGEKLKVKNRTFDITKAKMAKMAETIGFNEVCDNSGKFCSPKEAARIGDFRVSLPLFVLAANVGLVDIDVSGNVTPGKKSPELLSEAPRFFAKKLFETYMKSKEIHEIHYVTYISVYDGETWVDWEKCRAPIVKLLKTCPVGRWVNFNDFEKYMVMFEGNFFRGLLNTKVFVQGHESGYYSPIPDWKSCEARIIRVVLAILGAIGILDVAYTERTARFENIKNDYCVGVSGFRVTPLGAWILGLSKKYAPNEKANGLQPAEGRLVVQPDHTVVISGLNNRVKHESYLSGFLTKVSSEDNASIYKIDFASMVRAYNDGVYPNEIKAYLEKAVSDSQPLPDNVARSFKDWQSKADKIKIRKVTLVECDDELILEELIHAKSMRKVLGDKIKYAAVITDEKDKTRVKSCAEKNGWLVKIKR